MKALELRYRALMNKRKSGLPSEYQQVEYLESTGTQYIDTGFILNNNSRVTMSGYIPEMGNQVTTFPNVFGGRTDWNNNFAVGFQRNDNGVFYRYHQQSGSPNLVKNQGDFTLDCNRNVWNTSFSNGQSGSYTFTETEFSTARNAYLFCSNNSTGRAIAVMKLYSCEFYDNGTLVREFVPCYRKADNVAGLYDKVNGEFYTNKGTGEFIVGGNV